MSKDGLYGDAEAGETVYAAVVIDRQGRNVSHCQHRHKTRTSATRCADRFLLPAVRKAGREWSESAQSCVTT